MIFENIVSLLKVRSYEVGRLPQLPRFVAICAGYSISCSRSLRMTLCALHATAQHIASNPLELLLPGI